VSCDHKDYIEPSVGTPVFTITGLRNGEPFTLSAGENGMIQTAQLERNKYGEIEWMSAFSDANCPTCDPVFSLVLIDQQGADMENCTDFELFDSSELQFAQEASSSEFDECLLSIDGIDQGTQITFSAPGAVSLSEQSFSFPTEGLYELSAEFELENPGGSDDNEVEIHQTIYAGDHMRVSAPFLFEFLENEPNEEQEVRLHFPTLPELRATHWVVNGSLSEEESITLDIDQNTQTTIEIHYINDVSGLQGSYTLQFDHGFPNIGNCEEDEHIMPAPSMNVDWVSPVLNYEKAFITYVYAGKTFTSATPLNTSETAQFRLLGYTPYAAGLQGNTAIELNTSFSVKLVEVGNESNVMELTNCSATFGFAIQN
jgi:hypothetical protein